MPFRFNPFTGNLDEVDTTAAGGSDTQVQFNDGGKLAGDSGLVFNKTSNKLTTGGDVELNDGGANTTTLQLVTPTANRTISFPDATGTVGLVAGSSGQLLYNASGANAGASTLTYDGSILTSSGSFINSYNATASSPAKAFTGTWFTGGTSTTTKPQVLIEPTGTTSTAWSTSGTGLGINAASGFAGNLLDLQVNGTSFAKISSTGTLSLWSGITFSTAAPSAGGNWIFSGIVIGSSLKTSAQILFGTGNTTILIEDAANTLAQRNGTNAQKTNIYDTYTSATDYHRVTIATARATLTNVSGASVTAAGLIPAGAVVMGVTSKVTTALGTANGTTGYKIGTATDDDRWGSITGTAAGTTSDNRNWTAGTIECFPTDTDIIVTATGGNFNGTGVIYLSVQYMTGQAD
jgi:hypothetical protein